MEFALDHYAILAEQAQNICQSRTELLDKLNKLNGVQAYPSAANFILFKVLDEDVNQVFEKLLAEKILIKNVSRQDKLVQCLRVTVGTDAENQSFLAALKKILSQS